MNDFPEHDFFETYTRRKQTRYFSQTSIPSEFKIKEIVELANNYTPIKNDIWHFSIDVYGPEYKEQKDSLVLQTMADPFLINLYQIGGEKEKLLPEVSTLYSQWYEDRDKFMVEDHTYKYRFNDQVRAPYLLKYKKKSFAHVPEKSDETPNVNTWSENENTDDLAWIGASMHAYSVCLLANDFEFDTSFCRCFFPNRYNNNDIMKSEEDYNDYIFTVSIGYEDNNKVDKADIARYFRQRPSYKPEFSKVVNWNESST